jgi:hypothetical protein
MKPEFKFDHAELNEYRIYFGSQPYLHVFIKGRALHVDVKKTTLFTKRSTNTLCFIPVLDVTSEYRWWRMFKRTQKTRREKAELQVCKVLDEILEHYARFVAQLIVE